MKRIKVVLHNGTAKTSASGYTGGGCKGPLENVVNALGGTVQKETITAEGALPDDPISDEHTETVLA